jgi:hypothetical protein
MLKENRILKRLVRGLSLLCLAGLLAACKSSYLTDLAARPGDRLFWDDFSDQMNAWPSLSDSTGAMGYSEHAYRIVVSAANYELWALSGHVYGNVRIEADATRLAGPEQNQFGLICRAVDHDNFYFFLISSDGYFAVGKVIDDKPTLLGQKMMSYTPGIATGNVPNHLRFDCIGQTLTAYVNGHAVAMVTDSDFSQGDAGLLAGAFDTPGVDIAFDNFVVFKP